MTRNILLIAVLNTLVGLGGTNCCVGQQPSDSVADLVGALQHVDANVRHSARSALATKIATLDADARAEVAKTAIPVLIKNFNENDWRVGRSASYVLVALGPQAKAAVQPLSRYIAQNGTRPYSATQYAMDALAAIGPAAKSSVPTLIQYLSLQFSRDGITRQRVLAHNALTVLGKIGRDAKTAVPLISRIIRDPQSNSTYKGTAINALGLIADDSDSVRLLAELVVSREAGMYYSGEAARALGNMGSHAKMVPALLAILQEKAVPALVTILEDKYGNSYVREAAAEGLGGIGPAAKAALPVLQEASSDFNVKVSSAAVSAIAAIQYSPGEPSQYQRDEAVEVLWQGVWYKAIVLETLSRGRVKIHYVGYGSNYDEIVEPARVRSQDS